jgi:pre-mRNA-processing factor SLU7
VYANLVERGISSNVVTKFRKGACTNCGAMTHSAKTCIERPRKVGAKFSGQNFGKDEIIAEQKLGYAAKRDRWNNYNPADFDEVI